MSVALAKLYECGRCRELKPLGDFSAHTYWCLTCKRDYERDHNERIRAGTWAQRERPPRTRRVRVTPPPEAVSPPLDLPAPTEACDQSLRQTLTGYFELFGFTALHRAVTRDLEAISKANRDRLAREGWVA